MKKKNETIEVVRERERESNSLEKIGFNFDVKNLKKYIEKRRIDFLKRKKRIKLLRESLSFL